MFPTLSSRPKHLYINARLHVICVSATLHHKDWRFSLGEPYLLLTPRRLRRLRLMLGRRDPRLNQILDVAIRMVDDPAEYCKVMGVRLPRTMRPETPRASILCPRCDHVHYPHPLDADLPCPDCQAAMHRNEAFKPSPKLLTDRRADRAARKNIGESDPASVYNGHLAPNWRINAKRRLERDWEEACRRISMGLSYRRVAAELECSVGLLHKKVQEQKYWESN
ncbi:MAG: hypothetical protein LUC93_12110 [Planctomycetaceae bacterium]|nr:hypothetical protein [Planctomycetaceae bacterium]